MLEQVRLGQDRLKIRPSFLLCCFISSYFVGDI